MGTIEAVKHIQTQKKAPNSEGRQTAEAAVKDKVQREIIGALAKQRQSNIMAYRGDKPAEMMRCLQDMEQHYRGALEEKVWEMFEMREANEALAKSVSDTQIARAKEIAIAKAREEEWNRHEARMHEAEETALRLQTRVRALLKYEELYNSSRVEMSQMVRARLPCPRVPASCPPRCHRPLVCDHTGRGAFPARLAARAAAAVNDSAVLCHLIACVFTHRPKS